MSNDRTINVSFYLAVVEEGVGWLFVGVLVLWCQLVLPAAHTGSAPH